MPDIIGQRSDLTSTKRDRTTGLETANPLFALVTERVIKSQTRDGDDSFRMAQGYDDLTLDVVKEVVQGGADVEGFQAWIESTDSKLKSTNVPNYVPDHEEVDSGGRAKNRKWSDWILGNHRITVANGKAYLPLDGREKPLLGSILKQLMDDGYVIKSLPEMQTIVAEDGPVNP